MTPFVYAETAFHHEGDFEFLKELIRAAHRSGAQGVKFQVLLDYDSFISTKHSGYHSFKKALFGKEEWKEIFDFTHQFGLKVIFMPCDPLSMTLVQDGYFEVDFLDLHSVSFYDEQVLAAIKSSGIPLILGIGGRKGSELAEKVGYFGGQLYCIMVGFQAFPTQLRDVQIEKIAALKDLYPEIQIGYADHSRFDAQDAVKANFLAAALGAKVFEKHLTTREGEERFDWVAAVGESKFQEIVEGLKDVRTQTSPGRVDLEFLTDPEITYRNRQKFAVAARPLQQGERLSANDVSFKMTDDPQGFSSLPPLLGKTVRRPLDIDECIQEEDLR